MPERSAVRSAAVAGTVRPVVRLLSGAMLLDDLGGRGTTQALGSAVLQELEEPQ